MRSRAIDASLIRRLHWPMAVAVVGGRVVGAMFTLIVVRVVYATLDRKQS